MDVGLGLTFQNLKDQVSDIEVFRHELALAAEAEDRDLVAGGDVVADDGGAEDDVLLRPAERVGGAPRERLLGLDHGGLAAEEHASIIARDASGRARPAALWKSFAPAVSR